MFSTGQRWVSTTESELGLGVVQEVANRRVVMHFPAAGEHRTYAKDNAPLSRVEYQPGQQVNDDQGRSLTIDAVTKKNSCFFYRATSHDGEEVVLPEMQLDSFVQFSKPQDRLFAGQIDKNRAFQLRCETLEHIREQQQSPVPWYV